MRWTFIVAYLLLCSSCAEVAYDGKSSTESGPSNDALADSGPAAPSVAGNAATADRKIIYTAELTVSVKDFAVAKDRLPAIVKKHRGYVANVVIDRNTGERRSGRWQVRVPVDQYDSFLSAISGIGVSQSIRQTAQDVTEEFVDTEARLSSKRRLEKRILELLDDSVGQLKDVIEVERELERVRSEIEVGEGRLRFLKNQTSFTTVTIQVQERFDYVPPEASSLSARITDAWHASLHSVKRLAAGLVVSAVYAIPWIVIWSAVLAPIAWILRRRSKKR